MRLRTRHQGAANIAKKR